MTALSGKTILIVDDETVLRDILKEEFELHGARSLVASDGIQAIEMIAKAQVDLVLSDIRMPGGSGIDLLKSLKFRNVHTPIVLLMTAFADVRIETAYQMGAEAVVSKPFRFDAMRKTVEWLLTPIEQRLACPSTVSSKSLKVDVPCENLREALSGEAIRLGRGGLFIPTHEKCHLGEIVDFKIRGTASETVLLAGRGCVRWKRSQALASFPEGVGVEILGLEETCRDQVIEVITSLDRIPYIPDH